jgi:transcriptional regulator with XRE-family HTH domain
MFRRLLDAYPHPEGGAWTGARMEEATSGFVNASYFSNLLGDRIKQPGLDKLKAIAETMGFPAQLWLEEPERWGVPQGSGDLTFVPKDASLKDLLDELFVSIPDEHTGEPIANAEVARRAAGRVTEEELERMRSGELENPTLQQLLALSKAFYVDPAYWFRRGEDRPLVDQEVVEALRVEQNRLLLHRSLALSSDQKDMLLVLMEQLQKRGDL